MKKLNHLDGMKFCLDLIDNLKDKYKIAGYNPYDLSFEKVLNDIASEIGTRCYKDWPKRI